jgi:hypothetical protein
MKQARPKVKATRRQPADEILPEYDFSRARPNDYAARYKEGSSVVVLDPDVAAMFPNAGEVNKTLRAVGKIIQRHSPRGTTATRR